MYYKVQCYLGYHHIKNKHLTINKKRHGLSLVDRPGKKHKPYMNDSAISTLQDAISQGWMFPRSEEERLKYIVYCDMRQK